MLASSFYRFISVISLIDAAINLSREVTLLKDFLQK